MMTVYYSILCNKSHYRLYLHDYSLLWDVWVFNYVLSQKPSRTIQANYKITLSGNRKNPNLLRQSEENLFINPPDTTLGRVGISLESFLEGRTLVPCRPRTLELSPTLLRVGDPPPFLGRSYFFETWHRASISGQFMIHLATQFNSESQFEDG